MVNVDLRYASRQLLRLSLQELGQQKSVFRSHASWLMLPKDLYRLVFAMIGQVRFSDIKRTLQSFILCCRICQIEECS